ncbi:hypothetical protein MT390_10335 [Vibrio sp. 2-Bac 85]
MFKHVLLILLLSSLAGCVRTSVMAEFDDGTEALIGDSLGTLVSGTFEVSNLDGLTCNGTYNPYTQSPTLKTEMTCSDGRYGHASVIRTGGSLTNGSGIGKLNDGTKVRILLGDMVHYKNAQGIWDKADVD